ncbi:L-threonylcarbamoyladenylate synthase [Prochlorococcus sp. MIT 1300]|uniref:L-threonylcarbamoyladenylate synthase n=1 Tax=Prochlorococcus sp. MIT 1300 TaxID=3096218 RepID=UPI002A758D19|nr:L-threonylcarbamoyladenylate synthase [Prochlorococcus sp. MIT 1300]
MDNFESLVVQSNALILKMQKGSLGIIPTDTLPALAALPEFAAKIWKVKCRSHEKPLILMGAESDQLLDLVSPSCKAAAAVMANRYWPGELTLVLPAAGPLVASLNKTNQTIGLRIPNCQIAREFLKEVGPLATTSVNITGNTPARTVKEAFSIFPELPILGPLPWPKFSEQPSTVLLWEPSNTWKILRQGSITPEN